MVFDGASLPVKGDKHLERKRYVGSYNVSSVTFPSPLEELSPHTLRLDPHH